MALPILNPGFCPSPGELTLHGPQASSGPGFAKAPQVTGTLFLAAFVRSLGLPLSPASAPPLHSTMAHPTWQCDTLAYPHPHAGPGEGLQGSVTHSSLAS